MSIRMIAKDLYRLQQEVAALENALEAASYDRRAHIREKLRKIKAERDKMRKILDGAKEPPPYRKPM
jgi:protein-arginine kinase activator protein McsA